MAANSTSDVNFSTGNSTPCWRSRAERLDSDQPKLDFICRYFKISMAIQRCPDLRLDRIGAGAQKRLHSCSSLQRLEEKLSGKGLARYLRRAQSVSSPSP